MSRFDIDSVSVPALKDDPSGPEYNRPSKNDPKTHLVVTGANSSELSDQLDETKNLR
ncbi:hypothetical protein [Streptomyces sp. NPDC005533]|uniref:hypothetical protein n=1 Tax=Streptomyces sp. NPDC005533 TaxID=3364723 RepID=UPI0036CA18C3